ncbi:MAG: Gfo/Idh/MocA family oxidoreductase, partial [Candidatus Hydrogenedentes bacterium]|nr:Gfo/Idh/MocA family oxidoreductase [Candidatus Hydrogenedentota bacterium]
MMNKGMTRRTFLRSAAAATALTMAARRGYAANNQIRLGHIGTGGQGGMHVGLLSQMEDVKIVAVCDVDESHRNRAAEISGQNPDTYSDFRKVLERKDIDAVVIAPPDHWHVPIALMACEAGKDIYVEKPMCHNVREGQLLVAAAKKHGRVVQVGQQQRSGTHWQSAIERIHAGELGKITMVNAWNTWNPKEMFSDLGNTPDEPTPAGVDYDMWLGPAPLRPFNPKRFHGTWYFFWDYSGAMISAWGVHLFDIVAWAMGPEIESVSTVGGKIAHNDMRETPDTAECIFQCPNYVLTYSMRHGTGWRPFGDMDHGIEFLGDKATLQINRAG